MHRKIVLTSLILLLGFSYSACSEFSDELLKTLASSSELPGELQGGLPESTIVSGLKEALSVGTQNAVSVVSRLDGYFANQSIKIPLPEKLETVAAVLGPVGMQQQVDDFVVSMNRAAERAAPEATDLLVDAITQMSVTDARNILDGGDTAATDYFRAKTSDRLFGLFKPIVVSTMDEVGATRYYRQLIGQYESIPFVSSVAMDLDAYVTTLALDGLFYMVAQEEMKIRKDPVARVTELLKTVFRD